eukprot:TRINITY_DN4338_c0_g1_i4.p1 TRINITY_DN4338_c0_g1~~TRINITY_DN4338_c0_g1_i4.p1  ORF type:complete len:157 (+),score=30.08 TRINITY_DN4338_c0_g1_i4:294-764(+)
MTKRSDHIAVIITVTNETKVIDSTPEHGLRFLDLREYMRFNLDFYDSFVYRRLEFNGKVDVEEHAYEFVLGLFTKVAKDQSEGKMVVPKNAEVVAALYKKMGLLNNMKQSSDFSVGDFCRDKNMRLQHNAILSGEMQIVIENPTETQKNLLLQQLS